MEVFGEDFQFALEMVILNRNENGATLAEIRGNFIPLFHHVVIMNRSINRQ